jgi:hypothetical protein
MSAPPISTLLEMPDDDLYSLLAERLNEGQRNIFPLPLQERLRIARRLVEQVGSDLRANICANVAIRKAAETHDAVHLVILVADVIAESPQTVHATLIAALLVRIGIRKICSGIWQ